MFDIDFYKSAFDNNYKRIWDTYERMRVLLESEKREKIKEEKKEEKTANGDDVNLLDEIAAGLNALDRLEIKLQREKELVYSIIEAEEIINNSEEEIKNKISESFMNFIKNHKFVDYEVDYSNVNKDFINKLSPCTMPIIGLIYMNYLVSEEEKKLMNEKCVNLNIDWKNRKNK